MDQQNEENVVENNNEANSNGGASTISVERPPAWLNQLAEMFANAAERNRASNLERISALERQLAERPERYERLSPFEQVLLKALTDMPQFEGTDARTWEDFEQEFRSKAAQISSLPLSQWARHMHSRLGARALEHAKTKGLVDAHGTLIVTDFAEYCEAMKSGSFGQAMSMTAKIHYIASLTQTGEFADPLVFLREKEKYLNQIPEGDMAGYIRASLALMGMDTNLVTAITPNPSSKPPADGLYHSYADVRQQVIAVLGMQKMVLQSAAQAQQKRHASSWSVPNTGHPNKGANSVPYHAKSFNTNHGQAKSGFASTSVGNKYAPLANAVLPPPPAHSARENPYSNIVCTDCGEKGHTSKGYYKCSLHVPSKKPKPFAPAKK
jgi:hypothetical protein